MIVAIRIGVPKHSRAPTMLKNTISEKITATRPELIRLSAR
jgi:hypothetical protein